MLLSDDHMAELMDRIDDALERALNHEFSQIRLTIKGEAVGKLQTIQIVVIPDTGKTLVETKVLGPTDLDSIH